MPPLPSFLLFVMLVNAVLAFGYLLNTLGLFELIKMIFYVDGLLFPVVLLGLLWNRWQRKIRLSLAHLVVGSLALLILLLSYYSNQIAPYQLQVHEVKMHTQKLKTPIRILHISDIQSDGIGNYERSVFEKMKALKPDLIIHTGDLIQVRDYQNYQAELAALGDLFAELRPPLGIYNVVGDTDELLAPRDFEERSGVKTLSNTSLKIPGTDIRLLGLSLASSRYGNLDLVQTWLQAREDQSLHILMGHAPDYILDLARQPVDLCLAGHTHGGQVKIPFYGALITMSRIPSAWVNGYREWEGVHMNISAGIGAEHAQGVPALRFNCPPEMTLIHLD